MAERLILEQGGGIGREQLFTLLNSARELFSLLNSQGTILSASTVFPRLLGYPTEDLNGRSIHSLLHSQDANWFRGRLVDLSGSRTGTFEQRCRLQAKDGSWRWCDATPPPTAVF